MVVHGRHEPVNGLFPLERRHDVDTGGMLVRLLCQKQPQNRVWAIFGSLTLLLWALIGLVYALVRKP